MRSGAHECEWRSPLISLIGRRIDDRCIFARRLETLNEVKAECLALGAKEVVAVAGDITSPEDLIAVRKAIACERLQHCDLRAEHTLTTAWEGIDTVHILAGVPSTSTLMDIAGAPLTKRTSTSTLSNTAATRAFEGDSDLEGIKNVAAESRACVEINYLGTTLALATFLPLLARSSRMPVLHHLSSVAATVPAPRRNIYSATKAAGLMAVESCRVECEGSGVRFLSILPGTIDNDFRKKTAFSQTGGHCEVQAGIKSSLEGLLLSPDKGKSRLITPQGKPNQTQSRNTQSENGAHKQSCQRY